MGRLRKRIVLQGVRSACHVFVNGKCAGYAQGSGLPADFDITLLLHDGDNEIFLIIYPYSVGSYLERQTAQPWFGCIRDVYLEAHPALTLHDLHVKTTWVEAEASWRLDLSALLLSCRIAIEQPVVHASLSLADQALYEASWSVVMKTVDSGQFPAPVQTAGYLQASLLVRDVKPWSDETPILYDLLVSVLDQHGKDTVCAHQAVGFRQFGRQGDALTVNQRPVRLRPVRWSMLDHPDPTTDLPGLIAKLKQFKRHHLNTIWFCHEPPDPIVLDLCDLYGFYVIEDAPLETRPVWVRTLSKKRQSLPEQWAINRMSRLIMRDRNHACLAAWSCHLLLGGDRTDPVMASFIGRIVDFTRKADPTRLIHGVDLPDLGRHLDQWLSVSDRDKLADLSWFRLAEANEPPWCVYDHDLPPELLEPLARQLQPIVIEPVNPVIGTFSVRNRLCWTNAQFFCFDWSLIREGQSILSGSVDSIHTEPGQNQLIELWYGDIDFSDGADYLIRWTIRTGDVFFWFAPDEILSIQEQVIQIAEPASPAASRQGGRLRLEADRHHLIVSGSRFWLVFNRIHATLESWRTGDREWFAARRLAVPGSGAFRHPPLSGLHCTLMRQPEPTDEPDWQRWLQRGYDRLMTQVVSVEDGCDGKTAVIEMITHIGAAGFEPFYTMNVRYEVSAQGTLRLFASLSPLQSDVLPPACFSFSMNPARALQRLSWFGLGPERSISRMPPMNPLTGQYEASIRHFCQPDEKPGVFKHVRKLALRDSDGLGLLVQSDHLFAFDVYSQDLKESRLFKGQPVAEDIVLQLFQQESLQMQPVSDPLKLILEMKPVV